ncbi:MAG: hypothetical protein HY367_01300 [Candidatus Aenigmarchaeota archaeon]|nr:hypothetical protein [Candidatus Aenigmarchaeota archaeon]
MGEQEYSLWLRPEGKAHERLSGLISDLAEQYNAPRFEPHVTLLGDIAGSYGDTRARAIPLAGMIRPYSIRLTEIGCGDTFFKCVFIRAEQARPVMEANAMARKAFNRVNDPPYMPHLSILYGSYRQETKEEIIRQIGGTFNMEFGVKSICLVSSSDSTPIEEWRVMGEFKLR